MVSTGRVGRVSRSGGSGEGVVGRGRGRDQRQIDIVDLRLRQQRYRSAGMREMCLVGCCCRAGITGWRGRRLRARCDGGMAMVRVLGT
ncbi:hypothetical protein [Actinoplanes sp. CA-252034]|uniref:hypothetical protein n=1 Tax=Actinoplanes sp. CA-252034 TaxID=3239906 RepID=UPI003D973EE6